MSHLELGCLGKLWHHNLRIEFAVLQFYKYNSTMDGFLSASRRTAFQLHWFCLESDLRTADWALSFHWNDCLHRTGQGIRDEQLVYFSQLIYQLNLCFSRNAIFVIKTELVKPGSCSSWSEMRFQYLGASPKWVFCWLLHPISSIGQEWVEFDFTFYCYEGK